MDEYHKQLKYIKRVSILGLLLLVLPNAANAQISSIYDSREQRNKFYSDVSMPFNEALRVKFAFDYDFKKRFGYDNKFDESFSLQIHLAPVDTSTRIQNMEIERHVFTYTIEGVCENKKGRIDFALNSHNYVFGTDKYSIYGDNDDGYEVVEHKKYVSDGPQFTILYTSSLTSSTDFGKDLLYAIANNRVVSLQIPYVTGYGDAKQTQYFTFWLTHDMLKEWADLIQRQKAENEQI